jgi:hypothetical protein
MELHIPFRSLRRLPCVILDYTYPLFNSCLLCYAIGILHVSLLCLAAYKVDAWLFDFTGKKSVKKNGWRCFDG